MHAQKVFRPQPFEGNRVVDVPRVLAVDRDDERVSQILSVREVLRGDFSRGLTFGLPLYARRKLLAELIGAYDGQFLRKKIVAFA